VVWGGVELGGGVSGREVWSSQQQLRPSRMTMCCVSMRQAAISPDFPRLQTSLLPLSTPLSESWCGRDASNVYCI
jgi:hypothetical protein